MQGDPSCMLWLGAGWVDLGYPSPVPFSVSLGFLHLQDVRIVGESAARDHSCTLLLMVPPPPNRYKAASGAVKVD